MTLPVERKMFGQGKGSSGIPTRARLMSGSETSYTTDWGCKTRLSARLTRLTRLLLVVSENGKIIRKLVKINYESVSVLLALRSTLRSLCVIRGQIFLFLTLFRKPQNISGTKLARRKRKKRFDSSWNKHSLICPQIFAQVNSLGSKNHEIQNDRFLGNCFCR